MRRFQRFPAVGRLRAAALGLAVSIGPMVLAAGCGGSADEGPSEASIKGNQSASAAWEKERTEKGKNAGRSVTVKSTAAPVGSQADKYKNTR